MSPSDRPGSERPGAGPRVADDRVGTVLSDRYRLDSLLGEGGMGKVYAAEHVLMRKRLAVKILHTELTQVPEVVARFEREAMAAANIDHPNVAAATDFGKLPDGAVFLVLEFVQGRNLRDEIAQGPMAIERALSIAKQIGAALAAAHALEIVHRDLKPENVMLVQKGSDPDFVKVLDFGIARVPMADKGKEGKGKPITKVGMVFGTPEYMSPEQALGQNVDGRADVYALGVILFEMIAGVRPFSSKSSVGILGQQLSKPPPSAADRCPGLFVPPAVEQLLQKLLARDVGERTQTANDAVNAIEALLGAPSNAGQRLFTMAAGSPPSSPSNHRIESIPDLEAPVPVMMPPNAVAPLPPPPRMPPRPPPAPVSMPSVPEISALALVVSAPGPSSQADPLEANLEEEPASIPGVRPLLPPEEGARFRAALADIRTRTKTGLSSTYAWIDDRRARLPPKVAAPLAKVPTPALLLIGLVLLFGVVLGAVLIVGLAFGKHEVATPGVPPSATVSASALSGSVAPALASDSDFEAAKKAGLGELEGLSARYPKDGRVLLEVLKLELADQKHAEAVVTVKTLLDVDPKSNTNPEVASALWTTAQARDTSDATFELLAGPMGARGADMVYDLATTKGVRRDLQQRADKWLASEAFQQHSSPGLNVLVALQKSTTCRQRYGLLKRAMNTGDERVLTLLQSYKKKSGCGKRGSDDCNVCMRADDLLSEAIKTLEAKSKK
jgi:eukaryotic-like serine/threonine-protein kinase